jgi:hypothetical protein
VPGEIRRRRSPVDAGIELEKFNRFSRHRNPAKLMK